MSAPAAFPGARPALYASIFLAWGASLFWFHPRLASLMQLAHGPLTAGALGFFIVFTEIAWLYGFYNVGVIVFATLYRRRQARDASPPPTALPDPAPAVAVLYLTCNDFNEDSANSCLVQDYPSYNVYVLDDSSDPAFQARVDAFAARHRERARVVRRRDRSGFKAGNINHALEVGTRGEPLFALVDADEVLPPDFLRRVVPRLVASERCGFVQATHRANPATQSALGAALGVGIDIHWRWYHPLRNRYGFVMLLGHGAVIKRRVWEDIGGFPRIVSEDLAFSLRARQRGWHGIFAEDVVCYEDFPDTVRAFRIRHMKWTRGTCELFAREMRPLLRGRGVPLVEKLDVLFPALSLPLSLVYFLFVIDANLLFGLLFTRPHPLTVALGSHQFVLPTRAFLPEFAAVGGWDFFAITILTFIAPILCFVIDLAPQPARLFRFLCRSTLIYASLGPMSSFGVLAYLMTGKATFMVTGERRGSSTEVTVRSGVSVLRRAWNWTRKSVTGSHPDHPLIQAFEVVCGVVLAVACLQAAGVSFLGLAVAVMMMPVLHHVPWEHPMMQRLAYVPFTLIMSGMMMGVLGVMGMQSTFFGYGFHF